jgi:hypothetical protein
MRYMMLVRSIAPPGPPPPTFLEVGLLSPGFSHDRGQLLVSSIKGEVKKKHLSDGWNFSCFAAHLIERGLF